MRGMCNIRLPDSTFMNFAIMKRSVCEQSRYTRLAVVCGLDNVYLQVGCLHSSADLDDKHGRLLGDGRRGRGCQPGSDPHREGEELPMEFG